MDARSGGTVRVGLNTIIRLYQKQEGRCAICTHLLNPGSPEENLLSLDHKIPKELGGTKEENNLQMTHKWCNNNRNERGIVESWGRH